MKLKDLSGKDHELGLFCRKIILPSVIFYLMFDRGMYLKNDFLFFFFVSLMTLICLLVHSLKFHYAFYQSDDNMIVMSLIVIAF